MIGYTAQGASIDVQVPTDGLGSEEYTTVPPPPQQLDRVFISEEGYDALCAATAFFLTAKALRISLLLLYAFALPRFRAAHLSQVLFTITPCLVFLRMFFISEVVDAVEVLAIGMTLDILSKFVAGLVVHIRSNGNGTQEVFIPALDIGHVIEKTTAFFVLVAGEVLVAVAYVAKNHEQLGLHEEYERSCLGVTMSFLLCWIYFDADSSKVFVHAIRWVSSPVSYSILKNLLGVTGSPQSFGRSFIFHCVLAWSLSHRPCTK